MRLCISFCLIIIFCCVGCAGSFVNMGVAPTLGGNSVMYDKNPTDEKYHGSWQPYAGVVIDVHRLNLANMVDYGMLIVPITAANLCISATLDTVTLPICLIIHRNDDNEKQSPK